MPVLSLELAFVNKCDPAERALIGELFQRVFGEELKDWMADKHPHQIGCSTAVGAAAESTDRWHGRQKAGCASVVREGLSNARPGLARARWLRTHRSILTFDESACRC